MSEYTVICDYCQQEAELVYGDAIYPHRQDLHLKRFWRCVSCQAYVGCHKFTEEPLGRLANAELRKMKMGAHSAFDPIWWGSKGKTTRSEAYAWLSDQLGIPFPECHIGMFDVEMCRNVIEICNERKANETD